MAEAVEKINEIERRVKVKVPIAPLQNEISERFKQIMKTARVQGFRPGKVPLKIVEQQYGGDVKSEIYSKAIEQKFGEFVQENNIRVAGMPDIQHDPLGSITKDFEFTATFEVFPEFKLADIKTIKISNPEVKVEKENIEKTINIIRKQRATFKSVDRACKLDDKVTVKLNSYIDSELAESSGDEPMEFLLGDNTRVKSFDEQIIGLSKGDGKDFELRYPKDYHVEQLAGKNVQYSVVVVEVFQTNLPSIDESFTKSLGVDDGDVKKLNDEIKKSLEQEINRRSRQYVKGQVFSALIDAHKFDLPKSLINAEINRLAQMAYQNMKQSGVEDKDIKISPEMFQERALELCKTRIILSKLVEANKLEATADQVKSKVEEFASNYDDTENAVKWFYEDQKRLEEPRALATEDNVVDWVLKTCKVETKKVNFDDALAGNF
jgi:trigger factor